MQLKPRLKERGLSPAGKKQVLIMRLLASDDMGLKPSNKESTKMSSKLGAAKGAGKPDGKKAADPRQGSANDTGFGAVAQPQRRVVKRAGALDADSSGSTQDDTVQRVLETAQEMARKEEAAVEVRGMGGGKYQFFH